MTLFTEKLEKIQPILRKSLKHSSIEIQPLIAWQKCQLYDGGLRYENQMINKMFVNVGVKKSKPILPKYVSIDNGHTTIPGLFVAGDIRFEVGKLKLLVGAAHDAMQASNSANQFINKQSHYQPIVSTHDPVFKGWDL